MLVSTEMTRSRFDMIAAVSEKSLSSSPVSTAASLSRTSCCTLTNVASTSKSGNKNERLIASCGWTRRGRS